MAYSSEMRGKRETMKNELTLTVFPTRSSDLPQGQGEGPRGSPAVYQRQHQIQKCVRTLSASESGSPEQNQLLTVDEFADQLRITRACVRRWILERRVAVVKVGRLVRLPSSEVRRIVEEGFRPAHGPEKRGSRFHLTS
jgi:excisionase family DNA binding protein